MLDLSLAFAICIALGLFWFLPTVWILCQSSSCIPNFDKAWSLMGQHFPLLSKQLASQVLRFWNEYERRCNNGLQRFAECLFACLVSSSHMFMTSFWSKASSSEIGWSFEACRDLFEFFMNILHCTVVSTGLFFLLTRGNLIIPQIQLFCSVAPRNSLMGVSDMRMYSETLWHLRCYASRLPSIIFVKRALQRKTSAAETRK